MPRFRAERALYSWERILNSRGGHGDPYFWRAFGNKGRHHIIFLHETFCI